MCEPLYFLLSIIINVLAIIGLFIYVVKTGQIASANEKHNEIITTPAITVQIFNRGQGFGEYMMVPPQGSPSKIYTGIINHTSIHANLKILVSFEGIVCGKRIEGSFKNKYYNGNDEWEFAAREIFFGNLSIDDFGNLDRCKEGDYVFLNIEFKTKPFGSSLDYKNNPRKQYYWDVDKKVWIPSPTPLIAKEN